MESFFRVLFLILFSLKKNEISGDSNLFSKINFSQIKKVSLADRVGMHMKNAGPQRPISTGLNQVANGLTNPPPPAEVDALVDLDC